MSAQAEERAQYLHRYPTCARPGDGRARRFEERVALTEEGVELDVLNLRSLGPPDTVATVGSVGKPSRLFTVEENSRLCGWSAEVTSFVTGGVSWI